MTYEEFLADPQAQERVIMGEFQEVLGRHNQPGRSEEEIVRRAAAEWYGGPGGVKTLNNPGYHANVPGEPNMQEYTMSVWQRYSGVKQLIMSIYDDAELSQEEKERIRAEAAEATRQEAQNQQNLVQIENANLGAQSGAMGSSYQQPPDRPANTNPDNLADTEFRGSMDDSSYNYRMTNPDGTTALREQAGPDGEDEIIGPSSFEQGRYEPSGYVPGSIQDPQVGSPLKPIADFVEPIQAGIHDWFTSEINSKAHIWGYDQIPRYPNMNNELQDAGRDATALLAPMLAYTRGAKSGLKKVHTSGIAPGKLQALGNDPLFKMFSGFGLDVGVGVYVDSTAYTQGEDHNFTGTLKDTWPDTFKNVPNWLATSDNDSPDTKRHKNRQEGAGMNVLTELIGSLARVGKAFWKSWQATLGA